MTMNKILVALLACVGIAFAGGCGKSGSQDMGNSTGQEAESLPVEAQVVHAGDWVEEVSTYGVIAASEKIDVFATAPGTLISLLVKEGEQVAKDQLIAIIERDDIGQTYKPVQVKTTTVGVVESFYLKEGAKAPVGSPILSISRRSNPKLVVELGETDLPKISVHQIAVIRVDAFPEKIFAGKVNLIQSFVDPQNGKGAAEIIFDRDYPEIKSGMFGRANITINSRTAIKVASEALHKINNREAVFMIVNSIADLRFIETGAQSNNVVEVKKGLAPGDTVVTFASNALKAGSRVKIVEGKQP